MGIVCIVVFDEVVVDCMYLVEVGYLCWMGVCVVVYVIFYICVDLFVDYVLGFVFVCGGCGWSGEYCCGGCC